MRFLVAVRQAAFYCYNAKLDAPSHHGLLLAYMPLGSLLSQLCTPAILCIFLCHQITSVLQVNEFQEGEPCKFIIASTDQKLHFKASTIESKQLWVRALRTAILERRKGSIGQSLAHIGTSLLSVEGWSKDLMEPSPRPSPRPSPSSSPQLPRRMNGGTVAEVAESPLPSEFERVRV